METDEPRPMDNNSGAGPGRKTAPGRREDAPARLQEHTEARGAALFVPGPVGDQMC